MFKPMMMGALLTGFTLVSASLVMADGAGNLKVTDAWTTPTLTRDGTMAIYMNVENTGENTATLIGASSPQAEHGMIHKTTEHNGVAQMEHLMQLEIPAKKTLEFKPGGLHVMLMGLKKEFKVGDSFPLTLEVDKAEPVQVQVELRSLDEKNN